MASLPLLFGSLVAGAIVIDYGVKSTRAAFAGASSPTSSPAGTGATVPSAGASSAAGVPAWVPAAYRSWVARASAGSNVPAGVVAVQIRTESGFDPSVTSGAGAGGIAQFEPATFASYGHGSPYNPEDALGAYINYMNALMREFHGNLRDALAAYNAGPGNLAGGYGYADAILQQAGLQ